MSSTRAPLRGSRELGRNMAKTKRGQRNIVFYQVDISTFFKRNKLSAFTLGVSSCFLNDSQLLITSNSNSNTYARNKYLRFCEACSGCFLYFVSTLIRNFFAKAVFQGNV